MQSAFAMKRHTGEILHETEGAFIICDGETIELHQHGPWSPELTRLAQKHQVNSLHISETYQEEWRSLDFLRDLMPLRRLHVVLSRPANLSPVAELAELEQLNIMGDVSREDVPVPAADFTPLKKLRQSYVEIAAATESILRCASLRHLWIWNHCKPWLKAIDLSWLKNLRELHVTAWAKLTLLDLSAQANLGMLHLEAIGKLKSIVLHPEAKVSDLKLGGCGPFRIDWERMGEDLRALELSGRSSFALEEVLRAPNLERLNANGIRTFPPLKFLLKLQRLESFGYFTTPPGPKFTEEDWKIVRTINARGRQRNQ